MNEAREAMPVQDLQDRSIWPGVVATYEAAQRSGAATQTQTKASIALFAGAACMPKRCKHHID
jgi:hypothetical protein